MTHSLTLGPLLLTGDSAFPDEEHGFWYEVAAEGTDFGSPEAVTRVVDSLLADGSIVSYDRDGNRTIPLRVRVNGPTLASVAHGEAALRRVTKKTNTFLVQPPDEFAPASLYNTYPSAMTPAYDSNWDLDESKRRVRTVRLPLTCAPFAMSAELTVIGAVPVPPLTPTTVTVNDAESTTGWSSTVTQYSRVNGFTTASVVPVDAGDGVSVTANGTNLSLTSTLSVPKVLTGTRYLVIEMAGSVPTIFRVQVTGGVQEYPLAMSQATTTGTVQYVLDVGNTTVYDVRLLWSSPDPFGNRPWSTTVYNITATDTLPNVTTRQLTRTVAVGGTERTPASIEVAPNAATSLGFTIVHTSPDDGSGYAPPLRRWRTLGNTVSGNPALMSGASEPIALSPVVSEVPANAVPQGDYVYAALIRSNTPGTFPIAWQARTSAAGSYFGPTYAGSKQVTFGGTAWTLVAFDVLTLPTALGREAKVQIDLNRSPVAGEVIEVDEQWIFRTGEGCALTMLSTTGAFLWLDSPDSSSPVPQVWRGLNGDRSDARHPGPELIAQGTHVLTPPTTVIFTGASNAPLHSVSATYRKSWYLNAAEEGGD